jgi:sugar phosphate permease
MASVSVISGFLIDYFDRHTVMGLRGWQMMFVLEGIPSIGWAIAWWFLADDRPSDASWLSRQEAQAVRDKLEQEQKNIASIPNYRAAFRDSRVILLSIMYFCWSVGTYGFVFWLPKIVKNAAQVSNSNTGLLTAIPYLLAVVTMLFVSYWSDRLLQRKLFIWPAMMIGGLAFVIATIAGNGHLWLMFAALAFAGASVYTPCGPLWAMIAEMVPRNVVGESMALVNSAGSVGGFVGSLFVGYLTGIFHSDAPGFLFMAVSLILAGLITILVNPAGKKAPAGFPVILKATADNT